MSNRQIVSYQILIVIMVTDEITPNEVQSKKAAKKLAAKADKAAKVSKYPSDESQKIMKM